MVRVQHISLLSCSRWLNLLFLGCLTLALCFLLSGLLRLLLLWWNLGLVLLMNLLIGDLSLMSRIKCCLICSIILNPFVLTIIAIRSTFHLSIIFAHGFYFFSNKVCIRISLIFFNFFFCFFNFSVNGSNIFFRLLCGI